MSEAASNFKEEVKADKEFLNALIRRSEQYREEAKVKATLSEAMWNVRSKIGVVLDNQLRWLAHEVMSVTHEPEAATSEWEEFEKEIRTWFYPSKLNEKYSVFTTIKVEVVENKLADSKD
jgi:hypothetical protein